MPQVTEPAWELKKDGLPFKDGVLSVNEFTDEFAECAMPIFLFMEHKFSGKENYSENNYSKTMNSEQETGFAAVISCHTSMTRTAKSHSRH